MTRGGPTQQEREQAARDKEVMITTAKPVDQDISAMLAELDDIMVFRREKAAAKKHYETLRDQLATLLEVEGPRYFVSPKGKKMYAFAVVPETLKVNMGALLTEVNLGNISVETYEQVAPRKPLSDELKSAIDTGAISAEVLVRIATLEKGTAFVKYVDAD
jgi:hypothetical protein